MKKKENVRLKGQLKLYMQWPAIMTILLIAMNVWIYMLDRRAGFLMTGFIIVYAVIVGILYFYNKSLILADLVEFAAQYGVVQNTLLKELAVPYAILLDDGKLIWINDQFMDILGGALKTDTYLSKYIPELNRSVFPKNENETVEIDVWYHDRDYKAELCRVSVEGFSETEQLLELPEEKEYFVAIYLKDVTELNACIQENEGQKLASGLIYIDNYDEIMESVEEVRQSLLVALIDRKVNQYIGKVEGIVKKLEKDKYFIVIRKSAFHRIEEDRFSLLEDVKSINIGNNTPATLSIGIGIGADTYAQSYNYTRVAIDLALARGGDQAVVKEKEDITYYGGKREQTAKNTRVKARVKAEALREFIIAKDQIIVMGHKIGDVDSLGASIGIYRAATALEKPTHIVLNDITSSVRPLYESFMKDPAYPSDLFVTSDRVEHLV
ncbi:MAG: DHH family phosphoesterase, partial [Lachnospiraceae bacterium]